MWHNSFEIQLSVRNKDKNPLKLYESAGFDAIYNILTGQWNIELELFDGTVFL